MRFENGSENVQVQSQVQSIVSFKNQNTSLNACDTCIRKAHCQAYHLTSNFIEDFEDWMIQKKTYIDGEEVFGADDKHDGLYVVRSGVFESYTMDMEGELQVTGFHMPGDLFGIEKNNRSHYYHYVKALDTGSVCKIPFSVFEEHSNKNSKLATSLINLLGEVLSSNHEAIFSLSKMDAKRRFANFILDMWRRMTKAGFDGDNLKLHMSRADIANYLGLSVETVSRLFTRFQELNILAVNRRLVHINDIKALYKIANFKKDKELVLNQSI